MGVGRYATSQQLYSRKETDQEPTAQEVRWSGQVQKFSSLTEIEPVTVQPVVNR